MKNKKRTILKTIITVAGTLLAPAIAFAVVQTLNGQTGQNQSFSNDTNVTITSVSDVHSLGWNGYLPVSRGGTGGGSFTTGSVLFYNGASISQDNANLFWDDSVDGLRVSKIFTADATTPMGMDILVGDGISGNSDGGALVVNSGNGFGSGNGGNVNVSAGAGGFTSGQGGLLFVVAGDAQAGNGSGGDAFFAGGAGSGSGAGGPTNIDGGPAGDTGKGGNVQIAAAEGGATSGDGGGIFLDSGPGGPGGGNGGNIEISSGAAPSGSAGNIIFRLQAGEISDGQFKFSGAGDGDYGILDFESMTADRIFTLPDFTGTFSLLENNQNWIGLNKFESTASSSIYIGSSTETGCIVMGDSDGSGVTYVTANDGVLTASSTKPGICQ